MVQPYPYQVIVIVELALDLQKMVLEQITQGQVVGEVARHQEILILRVRGLVAGAVEGTLEMLVAQVALGEQAQRQRHLQLIAST